MLKRVLPFVLMALAIALFVNAPVLAEEENKDAKSHDGTVVSFDGKKLVMKSDGKEHTHNITADTVLMLDGKKTDVATFRTLKEGTKIRIWLDKNDDTKVLKIEALDKNADFGK